MFTNSLHEVERSISLFVNFSLRRDLLMAITRKVGIGLSQFNAIFYSVCHFEVPKLFHFLKCERKIPEVWEKSTTMYEYCVLLRQFAVLSAQHILFFK